MANSEQGSGKDGQREERRGNPVDFAVYVVIRSVMTLILWLPLPWALWIARRVADMAYPLLPSQRRVIAHNLRIAFGDDLAAAEANRIGRRSFQNLAMTTFENAFAPQLIRSGRFHKMMEMPPAGVMDPLHGFSLMLSAHHGPFEFMMPSADLLEADGYAIVRAMKNVYLERWMNRNRACGGVNVVSKKDAMSSIKTAHRDKNFIGLMVDQNDRFGIFVDFFGREAKTLPLAGTLMLRYRCPAVIAMVERVVPGRKYRLRVLRTLTPDDIGEGTVNERRQRATELITAEIQQYVQEHPDDWFWMHQRWKDRPDGTREKIR